MWQGAQRLCDGLQWRVRHADPPSATGHFRDFLCTQNDCTNGLREAEKPNGTKQFQLSH